MKKVYKKIITINFNDKLFTIFQAEKNRLTFLETDQEGKYYYPLLDDFIKLNDIYNNHSPFITDVTKYRFAEKLKKSVISSLFGIVIVSAATSAISNYRAKEANNEIILTQEAYSDKEMIKIDDIQQLDELLGYKTVSLETVHRAIDANENISLSYKNKMHLFLNIFMREHPDWDLRIFYENIKTIDINIVDNDYFANLEEKNIGGKYNGYLNQLVLPKDINDDEFYHELSHVFDIYFREYDDHVVYRGADNLKSVVMMEAMTNELSTCVTEAYSYDKFCALFNYFRTYVKFDYDDFNQKGINYFAKLLKQEYPNVDIDFILCSIDTINLAQKNSEYIFLDQAEGLIDELFKICTSELEKEKQNYYAPFAEFAKVLYYTSDSCKAIDSYLYPEIMYSYLEQYNALLVNMGYEGELITKEKILEKLDKYKDISLFLYSKDSVIPVSDVYSKENQDGRLNFYMTVIESDGSKLEMPREDYKISRDNLNKFYFMQIMSIKYYDIIETEEFWKKIVLDFQTLKVADLEPIPIYLDGKLISDEHCIDDLEIAIGKNKNGSVAYHIRGSNSFNCTYNYECTSTSQYVPLRDYLENYNPKDFSSLELTDVLNDYYLMDILYNDCFFSNVLIKDDTLVFIPQCRVIVNEPNSTTDFELNEYFFGKDYSDNEVKIYPLEYTNGFEFKVYLKTILAYYNILDEETFEYHFTKQELMDYYEKYLEDMNLENSSSLGL